MLAPAPKHNYRGRFAPSPTGPLHLGSLIAAVASYLDARANRGSWLLRIEDIDPPREQPGAASAILRSLEKHGLHWDEELMWQSRRSAAYLEALAQLAAQDQLFACYCSRQQTDRYGNCSGSCHSSYPGEQDKIFAWRVPLASDYVANWQDRWQGPQSWPAGETLRDFVVQRKDQLFAYQLAVVVDDAAQGISHVVRGSDLLDSTPRQLWLQHLLKLDSPAYDHLPVLTNQQGQKLSKQNHAPALDDRKAPQNLRLALAYLNQPPPPTELNDCASLLSYACEHWQWQSVPALPSQMQSDLSL
ncbi:tRNA glutamyl-Q(34) synthetase GluQRS [Parahaliea sp. F7430]|uniref:Glutamyl-Q tRNA(Asp) synthetase n=1 Tax=Sediminihaliea albiluteola TaxID=2758564 RepID=A0A7W2YJY6_9GAMM|nr:tRNA glutamyl-Q(34) synthetase GluQRS [Sediminihaliea albiluteola]MBA6413089.1 tRNA glutamyl-Q(34) synthetase GluQRS [Sediminihaliea albiluteola]